MHPGSPSPSVIFKMIWTIHSDSEEHLRLFCIAPRDPFPSVSFCFHLFREIRFKFPSVSFLFNATV